MTVAYLVRLAGELLPYKLEPFITWATLQIIAMEANSVED